VPRPSGRRDQGSDHTLYSPAPPHDLGEASSPQRRTAPPQPEEGAARNIQNPRKATRAAGRVIHRRRPPSAASDEALDRAVVDYLSRRGAAVRWRAAAPAGEDHA
jgi:hypothetical protein